jgi:hypothetical protein
VSAPLLKCPLGTKCGHMIYGPQNLHGKCYFTAVGEADGLPHCRVHDPERPDKVRRREEAKRRWDKRCAPRQPNPLPPEVVAVLREEVERLTAKVRDYEEDRCENGHHSHAECDDLCACTGLGLSVIEKVESALAAKTEECERLERLVSCPPVVTREIARAREGRDKAEARVATLEARLREIAELSEKVCGRSCVYAEMAKAALDAK